MDQTFGLNLGVREKAIPLKTAKNLFSIAKDLSSSD